jgi:hypothetical protein
MLRWIRSSSAAPRLAMWGVAILGGVLGALYISTNGFAAGGDHHWYAGAARAFLRGELPDAAGIYLPWHRAHGFSWILAGLMWMFGNAYAEVGAYLNCVLHALTAGMAGLIATRILPKHRWVPVAVAAAVAFNPQSVRYLGLVLVELWVVPVIVAMTLATLRMYEKPTWLRGIVLAVVCAFAIHLRTDLLALPVVVYLAVLIAHRARGQMRRRGGARLMLGSAVVFIVLLLPMSILVMARTGRPAIVSSPGSASNFDAGFRGLRKWATTMPAPEWIMARWVGDDRVKTVETHWAWFDDEYDRNRLIELIERREAEGYSQELDDEFAKLADRRIQAAPLRYYVDLPIRRAAEFWFFIEPIGKSGTLSYAVKVVWYMSYGLLFAIGLIVALSSIYTCIRRVSPFAVCILAAIVLARTISIVGIGAISGHGFVEQRYVRVVQPLTLILAVTAVAFLLSIAHAHINARRNERADEDAEAGPGGESAPAT